MTFPILGGLFQVYKGVISSFNIRLEISETYLFCEVLCSSWFFKELLELIKLILWRSSSKLITLILISGCGVFNPS